MKPPCFSELYCEQHGFPATEYHDRVFRATLYPHARPVAWLLRLCWQEFFEADREFVDDVARLTNYGNFFNAGMDFTQHHSNLGFLRRVLRLRISTKRMRRLVRQTMKAAEPDTDAGDTLAPFAPPAKDADDHSGKPSAAN